MRPVSEFIWSIPSAPLEIKDLTDLELIRPRPNGNGGRALVLEERGDKLTRPYRPLDEAPALFRNFAELKVDEAAIRSFAAKWGLLGGPVRRQLAAVDDLDDPSTTPSYWIEFLEDWEWQILWIRHALQLWDAYRSRDAATLAKFISVDTEESNPADPRPLLATYHADLMSEARWTTVRLPYKHIMINMLRNRAMSVESDLFEAALNAICIAVNAHLTTAAIVGTRLRTEQPRFELGLAPDGLVGAIWLQLASALEGSREFRRCTVCRTWYGCSTGQAKARRTYCSDTCKMRAYRHRKQKKAVSWDEQRRLYGFS